MWDKVFGEDEYAYGKKPNDFLEQHVGTLQKGRLLSLAEGEGRNGVFLAQQGFDVTGVDSSKVGLAKAVKLASECGVSIETVLCDLNDYQIEANCWDSVVSIFCHMTSAERAVLHKAVVEGLKPGGVFLLEAYTPKQLSFGTGGPPDVDRLMTLADVTKEIQGLRVVYGVEVVREVIEGVKHTGNASVLQIIAVKE